MKTHRLKSLVERRETLHDAEHYAKVVYTKVMAKSWIMSASTGRVRYETCQLVWLVATQIAYGSHLDISTLVPYDMAKFLP